MDKTVVIKSNKHGLILNLDDKISFTELCQKLNNKFSESSKFFGNVKMALTIEGRTLSSEELDTVIDIISNTTEIEILTVLDNSEVNSRLYEQQLNKVFYELDTTAAEVYPFNVDNDMILEFKRSVVILGNVSKTAEIHTDGSVFVLGTLEGSIYAGELGNASAKVFANYMRPSVVCIADVPYKPAKAEKVKTGLFRRKKSDDSEYNKSVLLSLDESGILAEIVSAKEI